MKNPNADSPARNRNRAPGLRRKANRAKHQAQVARSKGLTWNAAGLEAASIEYTMQADSADDYADAMRDVDPAGFNDADLHSISDNACTVRAGGMN